MTAAAARRGEPVLEDALAFRLHRTNRLLWTHLRRFLEAHEPGLSPEQWFVRARIAERGPVKQVDLAEPVLGDPLNVSRLVDALVARGDVQRSPDPADRRSWSVTLTPAGQERTAELPAHVVDERRRVFGGFGQDELDALAGTLARVEENVRGLLAEPAAG